MDSFYEACLFFLGMVIAFFLFFYFVVPVLDDFLFPGAEDFCIENGFSNGYSYAGGGYCEKYLGNQIYSRDIFFRSGKWYFETTNDILCQGVIE